MTVLGVSGSRSYPVVYVQVEVVSRQRRGQPSGARWLSHGEEEAASPY